MPIAITTQADFDAALAHGEREFDLVGDVALRVTIAELVTFRTYDSSQPRVEAYDSSQPRVVAWGSSQPRVVAWGSSQPRVEASGSSQPRVVAYDSSQPRVVAYDSSQPRVEAYGSSQPRVVASGFVQLSTAGAVHVTIQPDSQVAVLAEGDARITGTGHVVRRVRPTTIEAWCAEWGVPIVEGRVTLYKAVSDAYKSGYDFDYTPGTMPVAPDWDGGTDECGKGLHACPRPVEALRYFAEATRFIAVTVALTDIRPPQEGDAHPTKVKFRGCCAPCVEVDLDGAPIGIGTAAGAASGAV